MATGQRVRRSTSTSHVPDAGQALTGVDDDRDDGQSKCDLRGGSDAVLPFNMRPSTYLFFQLYVAIFVAVANGSMFCFGFISPALADAPFGFSTREINVVSTVGVIASYASMPTGLLYDRTSPRVTLLVGTSVNIIGWLLMFGVFQGTLSRSVASVAACYFVSQLAASFFETGSVLPTLDSFSLHEGRVVVIQKTFMGLGASIIAAVYNAFFLGVDLRWYFLFLCAFTGVVGVAASFIIRRPQQCPELLVRGLNVGSPASPTAQRFLPAFRAGYAVLAATILFVFVTDIYAAEREVSYNARIAFGVIAIALVLLFGQMLLFVPDDSHQALPDDDEENDAAAVAPPRLAQNASALLPNLRLPVLWLMWITCFGSWGAMTLVNSNSSQIYKAVVGPKNYDAARNGIYISLFGLGSALGRVIAGFAKEYLLRPRGIEVWWMFPVAPVVMTVALPLFVVLPADYLVVPFTLVGIATGVTWGSTVLVVKRMFVEAGRHYAFLYTAGMLTPLVFNLWLFSSTYESHSRSQQQPNLSDCDGTECIVAPLMVSCACNVVALVTALLFARLSSRGQFGASLPMAAD